MLFQNEPTEPRLVGIARLAANGRTLEAKRRVEYIELETRRFVGKGTGVMREVWTINPYRGCEFGCKYCYARYSHEFMELRDSELFETRIFAKRFNRAAFRSQLARVERGGSVWIGTATDPYQPAERRFRVTAQMLDVIAGTSGLKVGVTTKSDLVARDAALMQKVAKRNSVLVNLTITTLDANLARLLEPFAPRPELRVAALKKLTSAGIPVSVLAHPVLPLINDSEKNLDQVCAVAAANGAVSFSAAPVFLRPCAQRAFFPFLEQHFPHLLRRYRERFANSAYLQGHYPEMIRERLEKVRSRHKLVRSEIEYWPVDDQLELFPQPKVEMPGEELYTAK